MYIDTHAHLSSPPLLDHAEEILQRAGQHKVEAIVNICTDEASLEKGLLLAKRHCFVFNTAATTPHDVEKEGASFFPVVAAHAREKKLAALGETGLDYYRDHSPIETQKAFLIRYFELAIQTDLPLVFHCREAFSDLFALADAHYPKRRALLHCFSGSMEEAKGCLDRGWLISFSGIATFKKSEALRAVARFVPLDRIVIETDAPYLAPNSKRGKLNEPGFLPETALCIANAKGIPIEEFAAAVRENSIDFFRLTGL